MRNFNLCITGLCCLFSFFTKTIICQNNVVQNSSFENFDHNILPFGGQYPPPFPYTECGYGGYNWTQFNSIDFNVAGFTSGLNKPKTGIANVGFAATANNGSSNPYREYAIQTINLVGGTTYKIEFWVKRDGGSVDITIGGNISTNSTACGSCTSTGCGWVNLFNPIFI